MNIVREITRINAAQIGASESESWHAQYKDSAYIYIGGLPYELTEGDIICIFSQYGEPLDINLVRDKKTGKSKGFCFLKYEDQRSTILAVDNMSGAKVLGRTLRVDHVLNYRHPKQNSDDEESGKLGMNAAPPILYQDIQKTKKESDEEDYGKGIDIDDPMRSYIIKKRKRESKKAKKSKKKSHSDEENQSNHGNHRKNHEKSKYEKDKNDK
ncbi:hypothetical protein PNEG_03214 [Pneumocystis murina B123]|uniref:RRM domain-containing protein n=1 Tax=Pneumocystis murina (strain B123) TaxID=1069680 RepID=M7PD43_PNEMU|nr:hypothetical protein PNEG_03214 [Pneumocystis murina B123]EMR08374.1 hypothetical protein PNEG_03214 [Pneumocystis murina B123]